MKKLVAKAKTFCARAAYRVKSALSGAKSAASRAQAVLSDNRAESFVDTAVFSARPVHA